MPLTNSRDIQIARKEDYPELVETLCKAYDSEPHISWLVRRDEKRALAYRQFFNMMLYGLAQPYGEIYASNDLSGVAVWYPPGRSKISLSKQVKVAPEFIRAVGWSNVFSRMVGIEKVEYYRPREPHYYLQLIGVDPYRQGKGVGGALLKPVMLTCDAQQTLACLETAKPDNVSYYEGFGFKVVRSLQMPDNGPKLWLMQRTPRPQGSGNSEA